MAWGVRHVALATQQMVGGERHLASDGQGWAAFGLGKTPDGLRVGYIHVYMCTCTRVYVYACIQHLALVEHQTAGVGGIWPR